MCFCQSVYTSSGPVVCCCQGHQGKILHMHQWTMLTTVLEGASMLCCHACASVAIPSEHPAILQHVSADVYPMKAQSQQEGCFDIGLLLLLLSICWWSGSCIPSANSMAVFISCSHCWSVFELGLVFAERSEGCRNHMPSVHYSLVREQGQQQPV